MVTTVLKLSDMTSPIILADAQHENRISQYWNIIPLMPVIEFPTITKVNA